MPTLTLPSEVAFGDVERDMLDNEPPGLFPVGQDSVWGQWRKVEADYAQTVVDDLTTWYLNLDPNTVNEDDMQEWEDELGIPWAAAGRTVEQRRSFVLSRVQRGAFTRTRRRLLVESFILATFGIAISFTTSGVPFTADGIPFADDTVPLAGTYNIVENIPAFSYDVRILNTIDIDEPGLLRELTRITPAGISFTITLTAAP